ncbi:MAG: 3-phosphoglycerate dehydrogenase [Lachnospiraceae bacterium]|nr:3-phosphoglycerate dehydrogenase [Lachnospiraceae bacterium]
MPYTYKCLNPIAKIGLKKFGKDFEQVDNVDKADAILVRSAVMHEMEFSKQLLAISRAGAGVNNIPLERCAEEGIVVFNTPGANANGVKELVIAAMLLASRDITGGIEWVMANARDPEIAKVAEKAKKKFAGTEIMGKKLGIIGLGAIGVRVANAAKHLGMEVYGYDPYLSVDMAWNLSRDVKHVTDIEDIYSKCDFITIHVPAMEATKGMINKEAISKMKKGVILLNFARDVLCNEADVLNGINSGKIRCYATDFPNTVVAGHDHCIVIPHLGASTEESEDNCAVMAVAEVKEYLENGNIQNSVNYPACDMGICMGPRLAIFHKNQTNMIGQFTKEISAFKHNIANMVNKSRGDVAYTMFDFEQPIKKDMVKKLEKIGGVYRVRVVREK